MSSELRIYNGICNTRKGRVSKGRKKKQRRKDRAFQADGWQRRKANGLAPQFEPSSKILKDRFFWNEVYDYQ